MLTFFRETLLLKDLPSGATALLDCVCGNECHAFYMLYGGPVNQPLANVGAGINSRLLGGAAVPRLFSGRLERARSGRHFYFRRTQETRSTNPDTGGSSGPARRSPKV
jgi:hypothetical protein